MPDFITSKVLAIAGGALSLILAIALTVAGFKIYGLTDDLATANSTLAQRERDLGQCRANSATLEGSVNTQNAGVDSLKIAADAAANAAKAGQAAHEATAAVHDARAKALGNLPPLPAGANRCEAASTLIRNTLAGEHSK